MEPVQKKRIAVVAAILIVLTLLLFAVGSRRTAARVQAATVTRADLSASVSTNGVVEPIEPHPIRAQYATFVEKLYVHESERVKKGTLLLTLESSDIRARLAQARETLVGAQENLHAARSGGKVDELAAVESNLRKAQLDAQSLRRELEALQRLLEKQAATRQEVEQKRVALEQAEADVKRLQARKEQFERQVQLDQQSAALAVEQARNEVASLEEKVRSARVVAPVDGTVYSLPVRQGDFVQVGDLLVEMANLQRIQVRAFVDEPELGHLEAGQKVEITWEALPNQTWTGVTERIPSQVVTRGTRKVGEVICSAANEERKLLPNVTVNVRIELRERKSVLTVPRAAVHSEDNQRYVYLLHAGLGDNARLEEREVQVGIASPTAYEIVSGLKEGDRVATASSATLRNGLRVEVVQR